MKTLMWVLQIACLIAILAACNEKKPSIPFKKKVDHITIYDQQTGNQVNEITDHSQIYDFLSLMNESRESSFGDPEPSGQIYTIVLSNRNINVQYYFKKSMERYWDDKIYFENSDSKAWVPDKSILTYFP